MILAGLKKKNLKKYFEKRITKKEGFNSSKIQTILFIVDENTIPKVDFIKQFEDDFKNKECNIDILVFKPIKEKTDSAENYFFESDFGWNGVLKSNSLKKFVKNDYDLLINYVKQENLYVNTITLLSNSKFKVGRARIDNRLFDLIIDCNLDDLKTFNLEIKKYLEILNKLK